MVCVLDLLTVKLNATAQYFFLNAGALNSTWYLIIVRVCCLNVD